MLTADKRIDLEYWEDEFAATAVDVDLDAFEGLGTTRDHAGQLLNAALADPSKWGTDELHVEIETYTWDVLPLREGELLDSLEAEYRFVLGRISR